jgi:hypothetical protein
MHTSAARQAWAQIQFRGSCGVKNEWQNTKHPRASAINDRPVPLVLQTLIYSLLGRQLPSHCCIPRAVGAFFHIFLSPANIFTQRATATLLCDLQFSSSSSRSGMEVTRENASQTIHIINLAPLL